MVVIKWGIIPNAVNVVIHDCGNKISKPTIENIPDAVSCQKGNDSENESGFTSGCNVLCDLTLFRWDIGYQHKIMVNLVRGPHNITVIL